MFGVRVPAIVIHMPMWGRYAMRSRRVRLGVGATAVEYR